jgi:type III restriction enzyme
VLRKGDDLFVVSNELPAYKDGFVVTELSVNPEDTHVKFQNGQQVTSTSQIGGAREDIWRLQIEKTVEHHFDKVKENQEKNLNVKVLSLFFIDKVANYRIDPENAEDQGKFADAFEAAFKRFASDVRFKDLELSGQPAATVHAGYFSKDKKVFKDSKEGRETAADDETYNLIMKDKERLLSPEEPVQFIFSHSALREGWDNPNVFQICTLNESKSSMKKRQEIGRGLRIPVDHSGKRVFNEQLNRLVVVANENYEEFARKLQTEYEDDAAVVFGRVTISDLVSVIKNGDGGDEKISSDKAKEVALRIQVALRNAGVLDADDKIASGFDPEKAHDQIDLPEGFEELKPAVIDLVITGQISRHVKKEAKRNTNRLKTDLIKSPEFQALWEKIRPRTTYELDFDSDKFVTEIAGQIRANVFDIKAPRVNTRTARVIANAAGVKATAVSATEHEVDLSKRPVQDVLAYLQEGTDLTRETLLKILNESGTLGLLFINPQAYLDRVIETVSVGLGKKLTAGINYQRIIGADSEALWQMTIFPEELPVDTASSLVIKVNKSVYDYIPCDSIIEYKFAKGLDGRDDILLFVKLPRDFKIDTPVGRYNPDWGIVKKSGEMLVLVRETKATKNLDRLRFPNEATKLLCGDKHFAVIGVDYTWLKVHEDV